MNRIDSVLSHGLGKFKAVKARLSGLVGVFKTLTEQHGEVTALLERAKSSDERFRELWPEIRRELRSHEEAEVLEVYPLLYQHDSTIALADHHDAEAGRMEQLIAQIDELAIGSDERRHLYQHLIDTVRHHASEEERTLFPRAQKAIGRERAHQLDAVFLSAKRRIAASL